MNDRAWSLTVPEAATGLKIGAAKKATRLPLRLRMLCAAVACLGGVAGLARACWRGDLPLWLGTGALAAACSLVSPVWNLIDGLLPAGPFGLIELAVLTGWAASLWLSLAWASVGFWRSLKASFAIGGSTLVAMGALLLMAQIGAKSWSSAWEMSCYSGSLWREALAPRIQGEWNSRAVMAYDDATRTVWLRGAIELGASTEFRAALQAYPLTRTVALESPGGYVSEAQGMGDEILKRRLDTYVPEKCASACVDLFAAGEKRWVGPHAMFGLHRSGHECRPGTGRIRADVSAANFLRERGVADDFVEHTFETPYDSIWKPDIRTLVESGLATGVREGG